MMNGIWFVSTAKKSPKSPIGETTLKVQIGETTLVKHPSLLLGDWLIHFAGYSIEHNYAAIFSNYSFFPGADFPETPICLLNTYHFSRRTICLIICMLIKQMLFFQEIQSNFCSKFIVSFQETLCN